VPRVAGGDGMDVLGLLFLTNEELLAGGLALGESITGRDVSISPSIVQFVKLIAFTYPPAEPVARELPEPVEPSALRSAEIEK
jgi:hypothetical protein